MRKITLVLVALISVFYLAGCSTQVDPGFVGKKVKSSGVQPDLYETGRVWHMPFFTRVVQIDVSSHLREAPVNVIMADRSVNEAGEEVQGIGLDMDFLVNVRYRIKEDEDTVNAALRDMQLSSDTDMIAGETFYHKYGRIVVGRVTREVLGQYTPEEVLENLSTINATLQSKMRAELEQTPLIFSEVSLGPVTLPQVISERIQQNKDTELSEAQARAQQKIDLLEKQNQIELARQQAVREEVDAQSLARQNEILAESITPEVLRLRELQMREREIDMMREVIPQAGSSIFLPYGAQDSTGAQMRMFQQDLQK